MARSNDTARGGPRLVAVLVVAGLLVSAGFGIGLLVGASWEEPELLMGYVRGEAKDVLLAEPLEEAPLAAPPPLGGAEDATAPAGPAAAPAPVAAAAPAAPAAASPPPVGAPPPRADEGFSVQVGAFTDEEPARKLAASLGSGGFPAYVVSGSDGGAHRWRVRVGPVATRSEADALASRLKRDQRLPTWVVPHDG